MVAQAEELRGESEIERLLDSYPAQRQQALRAKTILIARKVARLSDLTRMDDLLTNLPEGRKGYLAETGGLRQKALEISKLQAQVDTLDRPFLAEPFAQLLVKTIGEFESQIAGAREPLSTEFRRAARSWKQRAREQYEQVRAATSRQPTQQVFRAGDPVNRDLEAFLFRGGPTGELERQVMLASGCPGLVIYGRRRMGKSTLVKNLSAFLPPKVKVVYLSMQSAIAF